MRDLQETHQKLLDAQNAREPQMSLRDMGNVLDTPNPSYVKWLLEKLVDMGLAIRLPRGSKNAYRIIDASYKHNAGNHE